MMMGSGFRNAFLKVLIMMKLTVFLVCLSVLTTIASGSYSQSNRISLILKRTTIQDALKEIENNSNFLFLYNNDLINVNKVVDVNADKESIEVVLNEIFKGEAIKYTVIDRQIIITPEVEGKIGGSEQARISGVVTDTNGSPLPGVTVLIKGTTTGTITDFDGKYTISAKGTDILVFSFVGMQTLEVPANKSVIDVALEEETIGLEEVVAVGYGVQKKSDVTGASARVGAEELQSMPVKDALQGMQGKAAGVDITNSQRPGEVGSIKIRGVRSITADQNPLYVVDGMVIQSGGIENINPSDIESIDVLKDASATAVYGSRGANGVILVTTKQGKEGKISVNYNGSVKISKMYDVMEMMNAAEWLDYSRIAKMNNGIYKSETATYAADLATYGSVGASFANIAQAWDGTSYDSNKVGSYDWASLGKQTGVAHEHTVSVSGGNKRMKGYGSFGYLNEEGTIVDQSYERYTSKLSFEATPVDWFTMGMHANIAWSNQNYGYKYSKSVTGAGDYYSALRSMLPWTVPFDENGDYIYAPNGDTNIINPINETKYNKNQRQNLRLNGSLYAQLDFGEMSPVLKGLKYRLQFGPEFNDQKNGEFNDARGINGDGNNVGYKYTRQRIAWTLDNLIYYDFTLNDIHKVGLTVMQSASKYHSDDMSLKANVASSDELWNNLSSQADIQSYGTSLTETQMASYMARGNYSYNDKYLLTASIRWDGASQLAEGNKWATFPSLALGWRMEQEDFLKDVDWISALKLRLGYGVTGNSAISAYATKGGLMTTYYNWSADNSSLGYLASDPSAKNPPKMANLDLGWERTAQYNLGLDYSFLKGRISGAADVYSTKTTDLLLAMTIPSLTGYTSTYDNVGETKGWGIDLQVNTVNIQKSNFEWSTNLTWSKDDNKIVKLANGNKEDINNAWFVGENIGVYYDYVYDGVWKTDEADEAAKYGRKPGQIRVKDLNEDDAIDGNNDRQIVGTTRPDWTAGMTNTFSYKNWEFSFFIYSRWGGIFKAGAETLDGRYAKRKLDYWVAGTNEDAEYYSPGSNGEAADTYASSQGYQNGTFIKLRNVNLAYKFQKDQLKRLGISTLKMYVQCMNPVTIYSKCDYLDTDMINYDNNTTTIGSPVTTKSLVFGVNVGF
ncbi:TonB-linked SusC/RagA family outer membrane protein [Mangrovibacterium marinum]|uniref:TonB-linked SusC/RagA family outer membrane protein n=2 Tax=Mangrovibacterium marinum TaxID=1639118 RepID=A0A2T5C0M3_9BACT|nr:TonB-linked SusC/RagA family outer membrane protein [Mangrovibacterium marinum]